MEGVIAMGMVSDFDGCGAQVLKTTDFLAALPPYMVWVQLFHFENSPKAFHR